MIGGRTFVNNVSSGAYAEIVKTLANRADKIGASRDLSPGLLQRRRGAPLSALAEGVEISAPQALLVSNDRTAARISPGWPGGCGWTAASSAW